MKKIAQAAAIVVLLTLVLVLTGTGPAIAQGIKPLLVRDADNPAFEPVRIAVAVTGGGLPTLEAPIYQVPAGKRLVIEFVSATCSLGTLPTIGPLLMGVNVGSSGELHFLEAPYYFPATSFETNPDLWTAAVAQQTRIYANPTDTLHALAANGVTCNWSLSGHLVRL